MRRITSRFVMLIATAAVAPLVAYGAVSIYQLRSGTEQSVGDGNQRVARQVSEQIRQYIAHNERVLKSAGIELRMTGLEEWQRARILKDYVIDFPEFREISMFDQGGRVLATSRFGAPRVSLPDSASIGADGVYVAPIKMDDDALPTTTIAVRVTPADEEAAWIVAEISLEELWRMVDRIRVGEHGYAMLLSEDFRLIAHGNPDKKRLVAASSQVHQSTPERNLAVALRTDPDAPPTRIRDEKGEDLLAAGAVASGLNWTVLVEQPTSEAFAITHRLERNLLLVIGSALLGTVVLGWFWGRSFITPHLRADPRDPRHCRRTARRARHALGTGRDPSARRRLQLDGRPARAAAGRRPETGTAGDVRPHRRRAGPRSVASDPEHRQQLQADSEDVRRRRIPRHVQADGRARDDHHQARARRPAQHRAADPARALPGRGRIARSPRSSSRCSSTPKPPASRCGRAGDRDAPTSKATCSRSAASTAT